ncbi:MAG: hypothetical protein J07HN6_00703 [Halonotius sp. J07HN6]|nr:MAG: hypothetical protein J07HN6_00703 [Halonotius sp. J07HN6]
MQSWPEVAGNMTRLRPSAVAVTLVVVIVAALLAAGGTAAATGQESVTAQLNATEQNATDEDTTSDTTTVEPGALLSGAIGVQQTEVDSEVDNRTYGLRIAGAATDAARADIVAERLTEAKRELADQQRTLAALREARANGTITEGAYQAQVATIAAKTANTERAADQLNRTASDLPAAVRERNGINTSAIERLRTEASELSGPETAAIARSIAGTNARNPMAGGPSTRGPFGPQAAPGQSGERGGPGVGPQSDRRDGSRTEPLQPGEQRPGDQGAAESNGQSATQDGENSGDNTDGSASDADGGNNGSTDRNSGERGSSRNSGDSGSNSDSSPGNSGESSDNSGGLSGNSGGSGGNSGGSAL